MSIGVEGDLSPVLGNLPPDVIQGSVTSNLAYIVPLEYGHSGQAPVGMVGAYEPEYLNLFAAEVSRAIEGGTPNLDVSLRLAVTGATLGIMAAIVDRTPVDTGTAKGSWVAHLPDGSVQQGATLTPAEGKHAAAHLNLDMAGATSRATGHRVAVAMRQAKIAERSAANYAARLTRQRQARAEAAHWRRVASRL